MSISTGSYAGSYAVTTTYNLPWKKKNTINMVDSKNKTKKKNARTIVHPIFEKCAALTEDKFWICIFQNCARDRFPRHFRYKNNLITYRRGNKTERILITDAPSEAFITTMGFFQQIGGILSDTDRKRRQKQEEERMMEKALDKEDISWKDVKTDRIKELLISEFICDMCDKMKFDEEEKLELTTTIKKGFMLKYFSADDIWMEDGRIVEIDGLVYNSVTAQYEIDSEWIRGRPGRKVKGLGIESDLDRKRLNFMELWNKYLERLEDKRAKKVKTYSSSWNSTLHESTSNSEEYSHSHSFSLPNLSSTM